jgi:hypothetical protein
MRGFFLGVLITLAACGDGTGPNRPNGIYDLVTIGGRSLPTTFDGSTTARCHGAGEVSLGVTTSTSAYYQETIWRSGCGAPSSAFFTRSEGTYRLKGDSVYLNVAGFASEIPGRLTGDRQRLTLRVVGPGADGALVAQQFEFVLR